MVAFVRGTSNTQLRSNDATVRAVYIITVRTSLHRVP